MKKLTLLFLSILFFISCQEELAPEDYDFRGQWDSKKYTIQIGKNGYGFCNKKNWGTCEGRVKIKGDKMIFTSDNKDSSLARKKFTINQRPSLDSSGVKFMILDDDRFEQQ